MPRGSSSKSSRSRRCAIYLDTPPSSRRNATTIRSWQNLQIAAARLESGKTFDTAPRAVSQKCQDFVKSAPESPSNDAANDQSGTDATCLKENDFESWYRYGDTRKVGTFRLRVPPRRLSLGNSNRDGLDYGAAGVGAVEQQHHCAHASPHSAELASSETYAPRGDASSSRSMTSSSLTMSLRTLPSEHAV